MNRPKSSSKTSQPQAEPTLFQRARTMATNVRDVAAMAVALPGLMVAVRRGTEIMREEGAKEVMDSMFRHVGALLAEQSPKHREPECVDCGAYGHGWMAQDDVWEEGAGEDHHDFLCLICFQKRLGRPLVPADFKGVPLNLPVFCAIELGRAQVQERDPDLEHCFRLGSRRDLEDWSINGSLDSDESWPTQASAD